MGKKTWITVLSGLAMLASLTGCSSAADTTQSAQSDGMAAEASTDHKGSPGIYRAAAWNRSCVATLGQISCQGIDESENRGEAETIESLPAGDVHQIALGRDFACALTDAGVWCWGSNAAGELGADAAPGSPQTAVEVADLPGTVTEIVAGRSHACAATDSGVWCWGSNAHGQVRGTASDGPTSPVQVTPLTLKDLTSSGFETCGLDETGESADLVCWGNNRWGQIDGQMDVESLTPTVIRSWVQTSD